MSHKQILVIDIGGISVKMSVQYYRGRSQIHPAPTVNQESQANLTPTPASGEIRSFPTPQKMTPEQLLEGVNKTTEGWQYEYVSIGYPGPVKNNQPWREPVNLGEGWMGFDFQAAFGHPVRIINDAAMQALGSYRGGDMLFLGLGTGLGTALILNHHIVPMEVAHMPFRDGQSFEQLLGKRGLDESGQNVWFQDLLKTIDFFSYALCTDYVLLGGGNARRLEQSELPENVYIGNNDNAFAGGVQLWLEG